MAHLSFHERVVISQLHRSGESQKNIAESLGRSPSTVSRELRRNRSPKSGYQPHQAHQIACQRRMQPSVVSKLEEPTLYQAVVEKLQLNYSPEQISETLKREANGLKISHQTIYRFLYQLDRNHPFRKAMRRGGRRNRKQKPGFIKRQLEDRTSIHQRPRYVEKRKSIGHWEMDLMTCHNHSGHLVTAVERMSGYTLIGRVPSKHSAGVMKRIIQMFQAVDPDKIKTMTFDNGTEFFHHKMLSEAMKVKVYFADPYKSYQRGTNENTNGLIRQYFPKTLNYGYISWQQVGKVQALLNSRPRLRLSFQTPASQFN